jgi:hypothetical protein
MIDLVPGTASIIKRHYRMSSVEQEELKKQLIELQGKDFEGPEKTTRGG